MAKSTEQRAKEKEKREKRPYVRPRLTEYGNVAKLTATGGSVEPGDGHAFTSFPGAKRPRP